jgi:hypothetical protein
MLRSAERGKYCGENVIAVTALFVNVKSILQSKAPMRMFLAVFVSRESAGGG